MPSLKPLPTAMTRDIDLFLEMNRGKCIELYAEAEKMRKKWEHENIALEDVVSVFVERCGSHDVAVSIDRNAEIDCLLSEEDEIRPRKSG